MSTDGPATAALYRALCIRIRPLSAPHGARQPHRCHRPSHLTKELAVHKAVIRCDGRLLPRRRAREILVRCPTVSGRERHRPAHSRPVLIQNPPVVLDEPTVRWTRSRSRLKHSIHAARGIWIRTSSGVRTYGLRPGYLRPGTCMSVAGGGVAGPGTPSEVLDEASDETDPDWERSIARGNHTRPVRGALSIRTDENVCFAASGVRSPARFQSGRSEERDETKNLARRIHAARAGASSATVTLMIGAGGGRRRCVFSEVRQK